MTTRDWEEELDVILENCDEDMDVQVKSFTRSLLKSQRDELIEKIEGMKRGHISKSEYNPPMMTARLITVGDGIYNKAISDVVDLIKGTE